MEDKGFLIKQGKDMPLGVSLQNNWFNFAVSVPGSSSCNLVLYKKGETDPAEVIPMEASALGVFSVAVKLPGKHGHTEYEYLYQTGEKTVCDPYAAKLCGRERFGEESKKVRGEVYVPEESSPAGYKRHAISELVLYKLHVRGFTMGKGAGVRKRGTYAGLVEKLPYLKELGINAVLLLPVTEFDELEASHRVGNRQVIGAPARRYLGQSAVSEEIIAAKTDKKPAKVNYWGYDCGNHYFAPKASYASKPDKACEEFKQMVEKFHEAGMDVYLEMMFDDKVSQSLMLDCLRYWVRVYGVDGFHISEHQIPAIMAGGDAYLQNTVFMVSEVPEWLKNRYPDRFLEYRENFCMEMRRYLKGDEGMVPALTYYMKNRRTKAARVHYIADHNGFTLADLYSYDIRHNEANGENGKDGQEYNFSWNCGEEGPTRSKRVQNLRLRMMKNALALTILSQGTPMLLAGDEFGRSKQGNNNTYCQDNELSWLDWSLWKKNRELYDFVKELIALRKAHPVLAMERELRETDCIGCGWPEFSVHGTSPWQVDYSAYNRLAAFLYCGNYVRCANHEFDNSFYVAFNMHWEKHEFELPKLEKHEWQIIFDTGAERKREENSASGYESLILEPRSMVLFMAVPVEQPEIKENANPKKKKEAIK